MTFTNGPRARRTVKAPVPDLSSECLAVRPGRELELRRASGYSRGDFHETRYVPITLRALNCASAAYRPATPRSGRVDRLAPFYPSLDPSGPGDSKCRSPCERDAITGRCGARTGLKVRSSSTPIRPEA